MEVMLSIDKDNTIHLTRGDTARLSIDHAENTVTGEDYVFTAEDTVTLTIKKTVNDTVPVVSVSVPGGDVLHIKPEDTKPLMFGRYVYDVQLTTAEGDIYTIIPPSTFDIMREVT